MRAQVIKWSAEAIRDSTSDSTWPAAEVTLFKKMNTNDEAGKGYYIHVLPFGPEEFPGMELSWDIVVIQLVECPAGQLYNQFGTRLRACVGAIAYQQVLVKF